MRATQAGKRVLAAKRAHVGRGRVRVEACRCAGIAEERAFGRKGLRDGVDRAERCWEMVSSVRERDVRRKLDRASGVKQNAGDSGGWSEGGAGGGSAAMARDDGGAWADGLDQNFASLMGV